MNQRLCSHITWPFIYPIFSSIRGAPVKLGKHYTNGGAISTFSQATIGMLTFHWHSAGLRGRPQIQCCGGANIAKIPILLIAKVINMESAFFHISIKVFNS